MFDDISKILKSITKGVVVMENGKPAYVVVPFEEYQETMKEKKIDGVRMWADPRQQQLDDASIIQKLINYDMSTASQEGLSGVEEEEIRALLSSLDREQEREGASMVNNPENGIHLEDLPF
ncbi:MAG: hypothetical protein NUV61_02735 [Candidatus Azambacteria bacterium]|nr:hypothetical protein [Candidatus Azambacteria bacterium]